MSVLYFPTQNIHHQEIHHQEVHQYQMPVTGNAVPSDLASSDASSTMPTDLVLLSSAVQQASRLFRLIREHPEAHDRARLLVDELADILDRLRCPA